MVDQDGRAVLSGSTGFVTFSGTPTLERIGVKIKHISVDFSNEGDMMVGYRATYSLKVISMTVTGQFDLEDLITSCSGLLCHAARALKGRHHGYDMALQRIMEIQ